MKYQVLGSRVLLKVKKYSEKKDNKYEGTSILMAENVVETETTAQTIAEVVQLGSEAYKRDKYENKPKVGDRVHFQRYGAIRLNTKDSDDYEMWVINDKDVLCIEA